MTVRMAPSEQRIIWYVRPKPINAGLVVWIFFGFLVFAAVQWMSPGWVSLFGWSGFILGFGAMALFEFTTPRYPSLENAGYPSQLEFQSKQWEKVANFYTDELQDYQIGQLANDFSHAADALAKVLQQRRPLVVKKRLWPFQSVPQIKTSDRVSAR